MEAPPGAALRVGREGRRLEVRALLGEGSSNAVLDTSDPGSVLRLGRGLDEEEAQDARTEHGLMAVAAHLGVHPALRGAAVGELWGQRRAASVMQKLTSAAAYLKLATPDTSKAAVFARSLFAKLCAAADLGLFLADLKFANVVLDPESGAAYLVDFDPAYVSYMDAALLRAVQGSGAPASPATCARARGAMVYLMLLLLYQQLLYEERARPKELTPRQRVVRGELEALLRGSGAPLLAMKAALTSEPLGALAERLARTSWQYFLRSHRRYGLDALAAAGSGARRVELLVQDAVQRRLFRAGTDLLRGGVLVAGSAFEDDARSCGGRPRSAHLAALRARSYPCPAPMAPKRYVVHEHRATVVEPERRSWPQRLSRARRRGPDEITAPSLLDAACDGARCRSRSGRRRSATP